MQSFRATSYLVISRPVNDYTSHVYVRIGTPFVYSTPIQEHSISDYDGDNGLNLLILVSITFPENFIVLNELNQKAYWV